MTEWALAHPMLTFLAFSVCCICACSSLTAAFQALGGRVVAPMSLERLASSTVHIMNGGRPLCGAPVGPCLKCAETRDLAAQLERQGVTVEDIDQVLRKHPRGLS